LNTATLFFYAAASFFLGLVAKAAGGALVLQSIFAPNSVVAGGSQEPWATLMTIAVIGVPVVFVVLAVGSLFVHPSEGPATASDIRELIDEVGGDRGT
jgi:hypothetical protein